MESTGRIETGRQAGSATTPGAPLPESSSLRCLHTRTARTACTGPVSRWSTHEYVARNFFPSARSGRQREHTAATWSMREVSKVANAGRKRSAARGSVDSDRTTRLECGQGCDGGSGFIVAHDHGRKLGAANPKLVTPHFQRATPVRTSHFLVFHLNSTTSKDATQDTRLTTDR